MKTEQQDNIKLSKPQEKKSLCSMERKTLQAILDTNQKIKTGYDISRDTDNTRYTKILKRMENNKVIKRNSEGYYELNFDEDSPYYEESQLIDKNWFTKIISHEKTRKDIEIMTTRENRRGMPFHNQGGFTFNKKFNELAEWCKDYVLNQK